MSKISEAFKLRKALIPFITAGDPNLEVTEKLVYDLELAGADIIELGIPFSDPLADGPVIQASHLRALKSNTSISDVFDLVKKLRKKTRIPLVFMLSENIIERYGADKFYSDCGKFGVDGVIVPDEDQGVAGIKRERRGGAGIDRIRLIAPTTKEERIKEIADASSGFIYLVSVAGVTGKRASVSHDLKDIVSNIRKYTDKPIAIGFGIGNPIQAKEAAQIADGVIVGSAIVNLIGQKNYKGAKLLVSKMRKALNAI
ncbi:tryptophan synthase subunit alpha [Candidatus Saganbacteria bacterium]|nr:tryptophan synthase subunit alpha [Candidatus Saganbacteria bacterium]